MSSRLPRSRRSPAALLRSRRPRPRAPWCRTRAPCRDSPSPRAGRASQTSSSPRRRRKPCWAFQLSLRVPAIDRNTKWANCLDVLTRGALTPGGVTARQVMHAVVAEAAELLGGRNGAPRRDAAENDLAVAVSDLVGDGRGVDE